MIKKISDSHWKCDYWSLGWGWGGMWRSIQTTCQRILSSISQKPYNVISGKITYCKIILNTCTYHLDTDDFILTFVMSVLFLFGSKFSCYFFPSVDYFLSLWIANSIFVLRFYGVIFKSENTNIFSKTNSQCILHCIICNCFIKSTHNFFSIANCDLTVKFIHLENKPSKHVYVEELYFIVQVIFAWKPVKLVV